MVSDPWRGRQHAEASGPLTPTTAKPTFRLSPRFLGEREREREKERRERERKREHGCKEEFIRNCTP